MTAAWGAELLGLNAGMVVQEPGRDEDTDPDLRDKITNTIDADMIEDAIETMDMAVLWQWEDDDDVVDDLVDAIKGLAPIGFIWPLTPEVGRPGCVSPSNLAKGIAAADLSLISFASVSPE